MAGLLGGCGDDAAHARASAPTVDDRGPGAVERIRDTAQHRIHAQAAEPVPCVGCHEEVAGQYLQAESWRCEKCHPSERLVLHAAVGADNPARACWSCHDFTVADARPTRCMSCHDQARGALAAIAAHDPDSPDEDCGACHRAHEEPSLVSVECEGCHDSEPVSGHDEPDIQIRGCASCHGYHEPAEVASGRCMNCHRQSRAHVSVNATFDDGHDRCVSCHQEHRFVRSEVLRCGAECHDNVVALGERKVKEHRGCIGCHDNHDVRNAPGEACDGCHGKTIAPRHPVDRATGTRCIGCHPPHRGKHAALAVACSACHDEAQSDTAFHQTAAGPGPACKSCHQPHRFALGSSGVALCRGCHGRRPFANAVSVQTHDKHADCFGCHGDTVAHQPAGPKAACSTCHQAKAAAVRKDHANCMGCHDPHSTRQRTRCGSCHEAQARTARKAHQDCAGCHDPHTTEQKKPCRGCHPDEARTAPEKHQLCTSCHDQHSTLVKAACASCHQDRATGIHAGVEGGCVSCHRPHGPAGQAAPPACTTCHQRGELPALHRSPSHGDCVDCHRSHGSQPFREAATCRACHDDEDDHEPTARMCTGCHIFGGDM